MPDLKPTTIFSKLLHIDTQKKEDHPENSKISHWLEKLHIQGEQIRVDNNRREDAAKHTATGKPLPDQGENGKDTHQKNHTQSGINEHAKNTAQKNEEDRVRVNDLVRKSNRRVISITSTFPWDLFPNTIDVEESRVTFRFSQFLASQSHSVDIRDISNVFIESSPFFSSLQVVSRTYVQNDIKIGKLNKAEARKVKRIIEGLRTLTEHNINTSNYELDELIAKIEEFHTTH